MGMPNLVNLIGDPVYALNHRWFCMVRPRSEGNLSRWVSREDFASEDGAEKYWSQYKADSAGMVGGGKLFAERFVRIADYVPPVVGKVDAEDVTFHVEHGERGWLVTVFALGGKWVSKAQWTTRNDATRNRIGYRLSSKRLRGDAWLGWLRGKFEKEVENGTV